MRPLRIFISHPSHYLTDCEPHGDGLLAYEYIVRLAERGHEIHVAVPAMCLRNDLPAGVHLHPVSTLRRAHGAKPALAHRLEYAVRVRRLLRRLQKTVEFDLIHQLNPVVRGMSRLLHGCGLPVVLGPLPATGTAKLRKTPAARLNRSMLRSEIRRASLVLLPNMASMPLVPKGGKNQAKVRELHFGVDTEAYKPTPGATTEPRNILFLANMLPAKGGMGLLEAFEAIADKHPDCRLRFAGSGPQEAQLRSRASESRFADRIEFLGRIPRDKVAAVMNTATLYCLPTYDEAFGMTALEAMACGKPVVGTRIGGLGLLIGATSPPVEPKDWRGLAEALDTLLSSPSLCEAIGRENRRIAVEEYDWEPVISRLEVLYRELLPRRTA